MYYILYWLSYLQFSSNIVYWFAGTLCSMGMIQQLVSLLRTEHSPFHEHVLSALCRWKTLCMSDISLYMFSNDNKGILFYPKIYMNNYVICSAAHNPVNPSDGPRRYFFPGSLFLSPFTYLKTVFLPKSF